MFINCNFSSNTPCYFQVSMEDDIEQDSLERVWSTMRLHPEYHDSFVEVHECLMKGEGPLTYINRHYIAIMAASRHYCSEMIYYHASILQGKTTQTAASDETIKKWLQSGFRLNDASLKIQRLDQTNMILAHKPWMLTKHHISDLTQRIDGGFKVEGSQRWSLSQVTQALTLMAHIHSFSSFVLGCGIMENVCNETNKEDAHNKEDDKGSTDNTIASSNINVQQSTDGTSKEVGEELLKVPTIVAKMETLGSEIEELEMSELARRFEKIETSQVDDVVDLISKDEKAPIFKRSRSQTPSDLDSEEPSTCSENQQHPDNFTQKLDSYQYVDFVKRECPDIYRTLRDGEFCWGEHAYSIISGFYEDNIARILDKKFMTIDNLTYMNIGSYISVDTR